MCGEEKDISGAGTAADAPPSPPPCAGAEVLVSAPMGKGFPVDAIPPVDFPTVLIFATGSGISPIRALIESGALQAGQRKDVRLYYGAPRRCCSVRLRRRRGP